MAKKSSSSQLKSMTAYGRGTREFPHGHFTAEIQSLNRRYLEINVNLPRLLTRFEMGIRERIQSSVGRGTVNVSIYWKNEAKKEIAVIPNLALAKGMKKAWEEIARSLGVKPEINLELLSKEKDILLFEEEIEDENLYKKALEASLDQAILHLLEMKDKEGKKLTLDLQRRAQTLRKWIQKIEKWAPKAAEKFRKKLESRIKDFSNFEDNEDKILREIAIFSEKVDITEEIVRFNSHLDQFQEMIENPKEKEVGKTLDFLIQELNREINTIGSKSSEIEVSQMVIAAKSELEKMREQVQNIE